MAHVPHRPHRRTTPRPLSPCLVPWPPRSETRTVCPHDRPGPSVHLWVPQGSDRADLHPCQGPPQVGRSRGVWVDIRPRGAEIPCC